MMLIDGENKIYMFDRDHSVFEISHIRFPKDPENDNHLTNTLVDGVNIAFIDHFRVIFIDLTLRN